MSSLFRRGGLFPPPEEAAPAAIVAVPPSTAQSGGPTSSGHNGATNSTPINSSSGSYTTGNTNSSASGSRKAVFTSAGSSTAVRSDVPTSDVPQSRGWAVPECERPSPNRSPLHFVDNGCCYDEAVGAKSSALDRESRCSSQFSEKSYLLHTAPQSVSEVFGLTSSPHAFDDSPLPSMMRTTAPSAPTQQATGTSPHTCIPIGASAAGGLQSQRSSAATAAVASATIAYTETDGVHTQYFFLDGNSISNANNRHYGSQDGGLRDSGETNLQAGDPAAQKHTHTSGPNLWQRMYLSLMPEGYPHSVTSDYFVHQVWDALNFASYNVMATLATRAMLKGVGVGSGESTVLSGTLVWLLKDISSLLSSIGVAVKLANDLDNDAKQWRMFADITTDIGLLLEVYSEHLPPGFFVAIICIASMFRSVWTVAGWSSRVALTQHFAIRNNMADVSARNGAQETLFTLVGMLGGMYMAYAISESSRYAQAVYFIGGTLVHLYFNYKSVKSLLLTNFNKHRALICINRFLATNGASVCSTEEANELEPVMWWREPFIVTFGVRPSELMLSAQSTAVRKGAQSKRQRHSRGGVGLLSGGRDRLSAGIARVKSLTVAAIRTTPLPLRRYARRLWPRSRKHDDDNLPTIHQGEGDSHCGGGEVSQNETDELSGGVTPHLLSRAIRHILAAPEGKRFAVIVSVPKPNRCQTILKYLLTCVFKLIGVPYSDPRSWGGWIILTLLSSGGRTRYDVLLKDGAGDEESLRAFFCVCKAAYFTTRSMHSKCVPTRYEGYALATSPSSLVNNNSSALDLEASLITASDDDGYAQFKAAALAAGWDLTKVQFRVFDWRVRVDHTLPVE